MDYPSVNNIKTPSSFYSNNSQNYTKPYLELKTSLPNIPFLKFGHIATRGKKRNVTTIANAIKHLNKNQFKPATSSVIKQTITD